MSTRGHLLEIASRYKKDRMALVGLAIIIGAVFLAVFCGYLSPYDPNQTLFDAFLPPSSNHFLGTDALGRDMFSRIIWGTRVSLLFGVVAAGVSLAVGALLGALAGFYGGIVDDFLSRIFEIVLMLPAIFLIILVVAIYGSNVYIAMLVVAFTQWPWNAKIARAQVLSIKNRPFVEAAKASGASKGRMLFTHVLPNGIFPVITNSVLQISYSILTESSLGFMGLGDPSLISWGQILRLAQTAPQREPWSIAAAGIAIFSLILGFNFVGNGINFAFNPRSRSLKG